MSRRSNRWRADVTIREMVLNLVTNWAWVAAIATLSAATAGVVMYSDVDAARRALELERNLVVAGRHVVVARGFDPADTSAIDAGICVDLNAVATVIAAGGFRTRLVAEVEGHPGTPFRVYESVGASRRVLDPTDTRGGSSGVAVDLARQLAISDGAKIRVSTRGPADGGRETVLTSPSTFDPAIRHEFGGIMWLVGQPVASVGECWVEFAPEASKWGVAIVRAQMASLDSVGVARPFADAGFGQTPEELWEERLVGGLQPFAGIFLALPAVLIAWSQRSRLALYRSLDAGSFRVAIVAFVEMFWPTTLGVCTGACVAALAAISASDVYGLDVWSAAVGDLLLVHGWASLLWAAAAGLASRGSFFDQLKG